MKYSFTCYGHENITCKHKTTLEFTKSNELSLKGDCIVGVKADFSIKEIKRFVESLGNNKKIIIIIETINEEYNNKDYNEKSINNQKNNSNNIDKTMKNNSNYKNKKITEKINAEINPGFDSDKEMVIRKSDFADKRTFAIKADKAACELNAGLVNFLKDRNAVIGVCLERHNYSGEHK